MLFTFYHINLSLTENNQTIYVCDTENPVIGEDACGGTFLVVESVGEDGRLEAIRNYHRFGNETAVDEFLSSMKLYASDYSEKIALRSGQSDRIVAIVIIIAAFIVLGLALFSFLLRNCAFGNYVSGGLLILAAGLFFLFTSRAFYFRSDTVIVNTMLPGLSAKAYFLFEFVLVSGLFTEKLKKTANIIILLYGVFITALVGVSLFNSIYFHDILGMWAAGVVVFSAVFMTLALISLDESSRKQKAVLLFSIIGISALWLDIFAVYFGLWQTGLVSKIFFLIGFVAATIVFLRIVPKNIKAAEKAEKLEKEKIILDGRSCRKPYFNSYESDSSSLYL